MIRKNVLYHKTAKGLEAIASRHSGLAPKLRSMLIMVDGKRNFEDLQRVAQALGDAEHTLDQLLDAGLIEEVPGSAAPPPAKAPAPVPAAAGPAVSAASLQTAQRYAVRRLTDLLGPNAEEYCLRIEAARNVHDLQVALTKAEGMVRQLRGSNAAAEFTAEMQAHLPAH